MQNNECISRQPAKSKESQLTRRPDFISDRLNRIYAFIQIFAQAHVVMPARAFPLWQWQWR